MFNLLTMGIFGMFGGMVITVCFLLAISPYVARTGRRKKGTNSIQDVGEQVNAVVTDKEGTKHHVN